MKFLNKAVLWLVAFALILAPVLCFAPQTFAAQVLNPGQYFLVEKPTYTEDFEVSLPSGYMYYLNAKNERVSLYGFKLDSAGIYLRMTNTGTWQQYYDFATETWTYYTYRQWGFSQSRSIDDAAYSWLMANVDNKFKVTLLDHFTISSASSVNVAVTDSGATFTSDEGETQTFTYSGSDIFKGFSTTSGGSAVYVPGSSYELTEAATLYVAVQIRPTYKATFYDIAGSALESTSVSYSPLTLTVTATGATISLEDGQSISYTYNGSEVFAGFATSSSGAVVYAPGNTYTLSGAVTNLYAKEQERPTYTLSVYDYDGATLLGTKTSYEYITVTVTATGATFTSAGSSFPYEYTGSEIFAGFATSPNGTPIYVPGKTYTISASNTSIYAIQTERPVYELFVYDESDTLVLSSGKSYALIKMVVTKTGAKFTMGDGSVLEFEYKGDRVFDGFASSPDSDVALYFPGYSYTLNASAVNLYVIETDPTPSLIDPVLSVFSGIGSGLAGAALGLMSIFYTEASGLTVVGYLAVAALAISVILLCVYLIVRYFKLK